MWGNNSYTVSYVVNSKRSFFSFKEIKHILLASAVLFFDFILLGKVANFFGGNILYLVIFSFLAVVTGFLLHEMAHKIVAIKYGCYAEFRSNMFFLLLSIATSVMGFLFAAPGAVYITGSVTTRENGEISIAGPLTNFGFAILFVVISMIPSNLKDLFIELATMNIFFVIFNMIPIHPLDGSKVIKWDIVKWGTLFGISILLFIYLIFN